jgi:predicted HicB family RNase H-like nuclease
MPGVSKLTKAMMVRLPVEVAKRVELNAAKREMGVSAYLRKLIITQVGRKR